MSNTTQAFIVALMQSFSQKNLPEVLSRFAKEAIMVDPHYPEKVMVGKEAIRAGLDWAFQTLVQPEFKIQHLCACDSMLFVEATAHHLFRGGRRVDFSEVFVIELSDDGLIKRLQAYPDYCPGVVMTLLLRVQRFFRGRHKK